MLKRAIALLVVLCFAVSAHGQGRRVALVIGNGRYGHAAALANPSSDATSIAGELQSIGFDTVLKLNLDRAGMALALRDFASKADKADVALFYFAGHGLQLQHDNASENYLVPVDARLADARDVADETIGLGQVLKWLNGAKARVVILDACRDNPLANQMRVTAGERSVARGLAPAKADAAGTLLAFSTEPGAVALDGENGGKSPFANALVRYMTTPGLEVRQMFTRVRKDVNLQTNGRQTPWSNDGLFDDLFLVGPAPATSPPAAPASVETASPEARIATAGPGPDVARQEAEIWQASEAAGDMDALDAYLRRFPYGVFALAAHQRLEALREQAAQSLGKRKGDEQTALQDLQRRIQQASRGAAATPPPRAAAATAPEVQPAPDIRPAAAAALALSSVAVADRSAANGRNGAQPPYVAAFALPEGMVKCLLPGGVQQITMRSQCVTTGIVLYPH